MKTLIKQIIKSIIRFFKSLFKYYKIEVKVKSNLQIGFRDYQAKPNKTKLKSLVDLVDFCNSVGINGETEHIKKTILLEWSKK